MLNYIKKFVLDILPSVFATIIGAYIVNHYIIPAATPKNPAAAVATVDPAVANAKSDTTTTDKDGFAKGVAEKAAIERATEKSDSAADSRKRHVPAKAAKTPPAAASAETTASVSGPAADDRRDVNDLARAAIERSRAAGEPTRPASVTVPSSQPQAVATVPAPVMQPPALNGVQQIPPAPEVFNVGTGAIPSTVQPLQKPAPTRSADASRPQPPADIPAGPPIELHRDLDPPNRVTTVADDVVSAAKSMIHSVLPR